MKYLIVHRRHSVAPTSSAAEPPPSATRPRMRPAVSVNLDDYLLPDEDEVPTEPRPDLAECLAAHMNRYPERQA